MSFPGAKRRANDLTTRLSCCDWEPMSFLFFWLFLFLFFLFSFVFLFCILIKRGERPTWQLAWLRAKVNFVLFSCVYFWICFVFLFCFILLICIVWKKRATDLTTRPPILVWLRTDVTARMISDAEAQKKPLNSLIFIFWNWIATNVKSD